MAPPERAEEVIMDPTVADRRTTPRGRVPSHQWMEPVTGRRDLEMETLMEVSRAPRAIPTTTAESPGVGQTSEAVTLKRTGGEVRGAGPDPERAVPDPVLVPGPVPGLARGARMERPMKTRAQMRTKSEQMEGGRPSFGEVTAKVSRGKGLMMAPGGALLWAELAQEISWVIPM